MQNSSGLSVKQAINIRTGFHLKEVGCITAIKRRMVSCKSLIHQITIVQWFLAANEANIKSSMNSIK